jgi:hypothetical protein
LSELPSPLQQEAIDFISLIILRYQIKHSHSERKTPCHLRDEPFIGLWKNREDMQDICSAWVQVLRRQEWNQDI